MSEQDNNIKIMVSSLGRFVIDQEFIFPLLFKLATSCTNENEINVIFHFN